MATYIKGDAVVNATSYELAEKNSDGTYTQLDTNTDEINFDLDELGLASGTHTLVVKAVGDGVTYEDSDYSNEVVYTVSEDDSVNYNDANLWVSQTTSSSGVVSTENITQSNIMAKDNFTDGITIKVKDNSSYRILTAQVTYNDDGSFKARSSWTTLDTATTTTSVTYNDDNPFNVVIATSSTSELSVAEMLALIDVQSAS